MTAIKTFLLLLTLVFCASLKVNAQDSEILSGRIKAMIREKDPGKNVVMMFNTIRDLRLDTIKNAEDIDMLKGQVALSFLNAGTFPKFEDYIAQMRNKFNQTSYLNMAADILYREKKQLKYAEVIAQKTVVLYDGYKHDPNARANDFPPEDWQRFMKMAAYPYYESYARILYTNGNYKTAFIYMEQALKGQELEYLDQSTVAIYAVLLAMEGREEKAYNILLKMAEMGKSSIQMNDELKRLYIKRTGNDADAAAFLANIQKNVNASYRKEVAKKMILDVTAPDFSLLDLNGKRVSLKDLRGKVVVLDFWATWCAPCIASMPAMATLSRKHPEVVFLFIATQETGTNAETRVRSFIKKNNLSIHVLMDRPAAEAPKVFPTGAAYKLTGIPAKMVIDKQGKLRFAASGYSSDSELVNELEAMIAITREQ